MSSPEGGTTDLSVNVVSGGGKTVPVNTRVPKGRKSKRLSLGRDEKAGKRKQNRRSRSFDKEMMKRKSLFRLGQFPLLPAEDTDDLPPISDSKRKMTDLLFLIVFVGYWIGIVAILGVGLENGEPGRLIYGNDNEGRVCGAPNDGFVPANTRFLDFPVDNDMSEKRFTVFPRAEKDIDFQIASLEIDIIDFDFFSVCVSSCPQEGDLVCTAEADAIIAQHFIDNPGELRSRDELIGDCLFNDDVRLFNADDAQCINNALAVQCFDTVFNTTNFLYRCFPEFVYEVEVIGDETGCLQSINTTSILGNVVEDCLKFKQVTRVTRIEPTDTNLVFEFYNTLSREFDQLLGDLINARAVVFGVGIGVAFLTGLFYIIALRAFVGIVIWGTIIFGLLMMLTLTLFLYIRAGLLSVDDVNALVNNVTDFATGAISIITFNGDNANEEDFENFDADDVQVEDEIELPDFISESEDFAFEFEIMAYMSTVFTVFIAWLVLLSFSRINRAIGFFKEAGRCIKAKPQLLLVPLVASTMGLCVIVIYVIAALYITSAGDIENSTITSALVQEIGVDNEEEFLDQAVYGPLNVVGTLNVYLFFGLLWSMSFVSAVSLMTISGVVSKWYWAGSPKTRRRNIREEGISISVIGTFCTVLRFHLGTAAFGSLLVALVQLVRYIAAFIQARMNKLGKYNRCVRCLHCALNCCLKCAENCIKFISRNAYIMTMLYGTAFCTSTKMAFTAFAHNLIQVATVTFLGDIILRFGQILVITTSLLTAWIILDDSRQFQIGGDRELSSKLFPVLVTGFLSWFMARQVLSVYNVAIDTILLSYCQDKKLLKLRNKRRSMKAAKDMREFVEEHQMDDRDFAVLPSLEVYA